MLAPIEWLKDYTDIDVSTEEFCDRMIMSGSNIETVELLGDGIEGVVAGKVLSVEKHPDATKLSICQVDVGRENPVQIVCGASNIRADIFVPVALVGAHVPGPFHSQPPVPGGVTIEEGELRGVKSEGMICSCGELGYDDKVVPVAHKDGIWILPKDVSMKPGEDIVDVLGLKSEVVDFEITPNRPDCLSITGMARESAATFEKKLICPEVSLKEEGSGNAKDYVKIEIKKPEFCRRYEARIATDIKVEESPWWMQKRLMYAGMRPINNIVDITNFVMLEYGQPLHAFDVRTVRGGKIVIDTAEKGSKFTTLDEKERIMGEDILMIQDEEGPIGIAGIMGGLDSEIKEDTTTILIESANFDGDNIGKSSKQLGHRTEASSRFEKGIDPNLSQMAVDRVCHLIEKLGYGKVEKGCVDNYPNKLIPWSCSVRVARVNHVLGTDISSEEMTKILKNLECEVEENGDSLTVTPPTLRLDLEKEYDFIEEIARIYGYDKLPMTLPRDVSRAKQSRVYTIRDNARNLMSAMGAYEIQTYSFVSPKDADRVGIPEDSWERDYVTVLNPLGEENSAMRTILTPGMLDTLGRNFARGNERVRAYEIGTVFSKNYIQPEELPEETDAMSIGLYGEGEDFFTLKGMVSELMEKLGVTNVEFEAESEYGVYHPGRCARFYVEKDNDSVELGIMGEVHPDVAKEYGIGTRCYACEMFFDNVERMAKTGIAYTPLPKYPSSSRDIAILVDEDVPAAGMEKEIERAAGEILESVKLFDVYRGEQVESGKKSLAFNLIYRDAEKTLTDKEVDEVHEKVVLALKDKFNAILREI